MEEKEAAIAAEREFVALFPLGGITLKDVHARAVAALEELIEEGSKQHRAVRGTARSCP